MFPFYDSNCIKVILFSHKLPLFSTKKPKKVFHIFPLPDQNGVNAESVLEIK